MIGGIEEWMDRIDGRQTDCNLKSSSAQQNLFTDPASFCIAVKHNLNDLWKNRLSNGCLYQQGTQVPGNHDLSILFSY